jgi:rod shape-determining protein MreD
MKKKIIIYSIIIIIFTLLQTTIFNYIRIFSVKPELLLIFVCVISYFRGSKEGMVIGLITGLLGDLLGGAVIGFYGLIYMYAGFIVGSINRKMLWDNLIIVMIITIIISMPFEYLTYLLSKFGYYVSGKTDSMRLEFGTVFVKLILPQTLYNIILLPLIYLICTMVDKFLNKDKGMMFTL